MTSAICDRYRAVMCYQEIDDQMFETGQHQNYELSFPNSGRRLTDKIKIKDTFTVALRLSFFACKTQKLHLFYRLPVGRYINRVSINSRFVC